MIVTRIFLLIAMTALAGCASAPQYVAADDPTDRGYYARKIAEDRYRVNFNGSRRTNLQDARDFALLRAAELTTEKGYDWFEVVDRELATTETRDRSVPRTGLSYQRTTYVERRCGVLACSSTVRPAAWTGMTMETARDEVRHSYSLEIVMGKGSLPTGGQYYDAKSVTESIDPTI